MSRMNNLKLGAALWGILVGLGLAIAIAACASQSKGVAGMDARKQDIQELWKKIRQDRLDNGMSADPLLDIRRPEFFQKPVEKIRQCPADEEPPKTAECSDVCSLKDDICDNAAKICDIADQLGDDAWARGKCNSAKASCKEATEKCCGCLADEKPASSQPGGG